MESFRKYLLASLLLQISTRHFSLFYTNCWVEKAGNFVRDVYFWSEMKQVLKLSETEIFFEQSHIMSYNPYYGITEDFMPCVSQIKQGLYWLVCKAVIIKTSIKIDQEHCWSIKGQRTSSQKCLLVVVCSFWNSTGSYFLYFSVLTYH